VFQKFITKLLNHRQVKPLLSDEHFSVDGTLIEAWASQKSFRAKDGSDNEGDGGDFRGQKRSTDPKPASGEEARLMAARHGMGVMISHKSAAR
jgi:hypothetical protein